MKKKKNKIKKQLSSAALSLLILLVAFAIGYISENDGSKETIATPSQTIEHLSDIPEYSGNICVEINDNKPLFEDSELTTDEFEAYSNLDDLGRCGIAYANICKNIMPPEGVKRGQISYKPTGWVQTLYNNGTALYNRCHLIAWQLGNENNNVQNLITGTRALNEAMIPYENAVANYIKEANKQGKDYHVLYRVTPDFRDNNLLAYGVQMEAKSVEDNGEGICFNIYIYNVQNGFELDYATGQNKQKGE